jgi:hypothetical protein
MYHDGGGLYLQVSAAGTKSWIYRFTLDGRAREMGLGPLNAISLAEARKRAAECRRMRHDGIDPIEVRGAQRDQKRLEGARSMTFDVCAEAYIEAHKASWKNGKHAEQWRGSLRNYASPVFGSSPVQAIDLALVMKALEPIWQTKSETASRLRGRIESVLDWATVRGYRKGETCTLAKPSRQAATDPREDPEGKTLPSTALRRNRRVHGGSARPGRGRGAGVGVPHPDRCSNRRDHRRAMGRG